MHCKNVQICVMFTGVKLDILNILIIIKNLQDPSRREVGDIGLEITLVSKVLLPRYLLFVCLKLVLLLNFEFDWLRTFQPIITYRMGIFSSSLVFYINFLSIVLSMFPGHPWSTMSQEKESFIYGKILPPSGATKTVKKINSENGYRRVDLPQNE